MAKESESNKYSMEAASDTSAIVKSTFREWISEGRSKQLDPDSVIASFDKASEQLLRRKLSFMPLWEITNHSVFTNIYKKAINDKLFRVTEKKTYKVFIVAGQLYLRFLKDKPWLKAAVEHSSTTTIDDVIEADALVSDIEQTLNSTATAIESSANVNPDDFVTWLTMQKNSHGTLYLERVARMYSRYLRSAPPKLDIPLTVDKRDVYTVRTIEGFDRLWEIFLAAPNFKQVNEYGHQTFSAGLKAYRRYLESLAQQGNSINEGGKLNMETTLLTNKWEKWMMEKENTTIAEQLNTDVRRVDFLQTDLCSGCNPVTCRINGEPIPVGTWRDLLVNLVEKFLSEGNAGIGDLYSSPLLQGSSRPFLLKDKPNGAARQISTGHWIYVNHNISSLVDLIGRLCRHCGVNLNDVEITYLPKTTNGSLEEPAHDGSTRFTQQHIRSEFRNWLTQRNPSWGISTLNMLCSDALYLYNNNRGVTLAEALTDSEGIEKAYNALEQHFTSNPRQTGTAATAAKGYIDTLQLFKKFIEERFPNLLDGDGGVSSTPQITALPDSIVSVLTQDYPYGFNFDTMSVRLLAEKSGMDIDTSIQNALKRLMFCRNDGVYFLLDVVADSETRKEIIGFAGDWLYDYGCFEISELYALFADNVNEKSIRNLNDFEAFYEFINRREVRCVAYYGTRIARVHNKSIRDLSLGVAAEVISIAHDEYGGTVNEDDLRDRFPAFSVDLLGNIIKEHAEELVKTEINGIVCYQTLDALGLSDEFSDTLAEVLEQIDEVGLIPNEEVLHTALSIRLGVNFKAEYNIPDDKTYRRLIAAYYKEAPKREWKRSIFAEVQD